MLQRVANSVEQSFGGNVIKQGDETPFGFILRDENGAVIDLQGATVNIKLANRDTLVLEKTAIINADNVITFALTSDDVTGYGDMRVEFVVTYADATKEKFPADGWQKITITPSLDNVQIGGIAYVTVQSIQAKSDEALTKSTNAETTANSVQEQFSAVVTRATDTDAMSRQAAISVDGTDYENLKARLDSEHSSVTTQLAEKSTKTELNALGQLKLEGTYDTLTDLQTAKPTGATGLYLVTADGFTYRWDGASWLKAVQFQSTGIAISGVKEANLDSKFREDVVLLNSDDPNNIDDLSTKFPSTTGALGYLYVIDLPIYRKGQVIMHMKSKNDVTVFLVEKQADHTFLIKGKEVLSTPALTTGTVTSNLTTLVAEGNGKEYIAYLANSNVYTSGTYATDAASLPHHFYASKSAPTTTNVGEVIDTNYNTTLNQLHALYWGVKSNVNELESTLGVDVLKSDVEDLKPLKDTLLPLATKSFNTLKFRETTANFPDVTNTAFFFGRWFVKNVSGVDYVTTINQGAEIFAKFTGTSITGLFKNLASSLPYIAVSIDGGAFTRMMGYTTTLLASGLEDKEHYIRIVADGIKEGDDLWIGELGLGFRGFTVDAGKAVTPIKPFNRIGWYIGDSITAGINVLGTGSAPSVNSAYQTYAFVACSKLNVANVRVGFGGTGVTKGGSGGVPDALNYVDNQTSSRLETAEKPDFIVINHGTNDNAADSTTFQTAYRTLIKRLNIKNPGIPIICMRPFNGTHGTDVQTVASEFVNCFYVDTTGWGVTYSDGVHPDVNGGQIAGTKLADELKKIFGVSYFIS